jgi:MYXO-CTERM domain-containing protein
MTGMNTRATTGSALLWTSGPYQPWQIIGLGLALAVLAFAAGWRRRLLPAVAEIPVALTACFIVDAAADAESDGLWPIGAALVAFGSLFGTSLVAALAIGLRQTRSGARWARRTPTAPAGPASTQRVDTRRAGDRAAELR